MADQDNTPDGRGNGSGNGDGRGGSARGKRGRPRRSAAAVMAATLALIALMLPSGAPPDMARRMAIAHGVYVALFTASGLLFRHASLAGLK